MRSLRAPIFISALWAVLLLSGCGSFDVWGRVEDQKGYGIEGVTVSFSTTPDTVTTDSGGCWRYQGLEGLTLVTVSKEGWLFGPGCVVKGPRHDIRFVGSPERFTLSGRLADAAGRPARNIRVVISGACGWWDVRTDADGNYYKQDLWGSVRVTPYGGRWTFSPASSEVSLSSPIADFQATPDVDVAFQVKDIGWVNGIAGTTVSAWVPRDLTVMAVEYLCNGEVFTMQSQPAPALNYSTESNYYLGVGWNTNDLAEGDYEITAVVRTPMGDFTAVTTRRVSPVFAELTIKNGHVAGSLANYHDGAKTPISDAAITCNGVNIPYTVAGTYERADESPIVQPGQQASLTIDRPGLPPINVSLQVPYPVQDLTCPNMERWISGEDSSLTISWVLPGGDRTGLSASITCYNSIGAPIGTIYPLVQTTSTSLSVPRSSLYYGTQYITIRINTSNGCVLGTHYFDMASSLKYGVYASSAAVLSNLPSE